LALSVDDKALRDAISSLAIALYDGKPALREERPLVGGIALGYAADDFELSQVFRLLQDVLRDLASFWQVEEIEQSGTRILESLLPRLNDGIPLVRSAFWLVVRLGM